MIDWSQCEDVESVPGRCGGQAAHVGPITKGIFDDPEALTEIASRAFARAKDEAIRENDRLGVPSYGGEGGKIVVRQPMTEDPWLRAMLDDVYDRLRVMDEAKGDGGFSAEEARRYWALVCELIEIDHAMRARERDHIQPMVETPAARLFSVIETWLWQVVDPMQLADIRAIRFVIDGLSKRPDAASEAVQRALAECRFYLEQPWT